MNPRPGNDDESKMRGHLGTELGNKITDTLVSIKRKDANGVTFTVKQNDARGKDMEDWTFEVTEAAGALGIPRILGAAVPMTEDQKEKQKADDIFRRYNWTRSGAAYTDLDKFIRKCGVTSSRKVSEMFNIGLEAGIIYKDSRRKYHYNGLQRDLPDDKQEDIPFDAPDKNEDARF